MPGKSSSRWTAQSSSCRSGGNSWAGSPTAIQPIGTVAPGASAVLTCTTPWIRTSLPAPSRAPGNSAAPVARKQLVLDVGAVDVRVRPDEHVVARASPDVPARPRTSAFSITTQLRADLDPPSSAVSTAPNSTRAPAPTWTSPHTTAVGATYAEGRWWAGLRGARGPSAARLGIEGVGFEDALYFRA